MATASWPSSFTRSTSLLIRQAPSSRENKLLLAGEYDRAKEVALEMRGLFGEDGYYLEIQDHGLESQAHTAGQFPPYC